MGLVWDRRAVIARHKVIRVPTSFEERWRLSPDVLEDVITRQGGAARQKLLVLNYPGNPDGLTYSRDELEAIATVLRAHGVWVVSDEIYGLALPPRDACLVGDHLP